MITKLYAYCRTKDCAQKNDADPGSYPPMKQIDAWQGVAEGSIGSAACVFECPTCKRQVVVEMAIHEAEPT